jgi:hypothetical protein
MAQIKSSNQWYGYLHENGSLHVKRYDPVQGPGDIREALDSDFVSHLVGPFDANTREEALVYAQDNL